MPGVPHIRDHLTTLVPHCRAVYAPSETVNDEVRYLRHVIESLHPLVRESPGAEDSCTVRDVAAVDVDYVHEDRLALCDPSEASA